MTARQRQLLILVHEAIQANGVCPSYREMAVGLGYSIRGGQSRVHYLLKRLEEEGYIRRTPTVARSIEVLRAPSGLTQAEMMWCHGHAAQVRALMGGEAP